MSTNNFNADRAAAHASYSNACIVILETYDYSFETGWYWAPGGEKRAFIKAFFDGNEIAEATWATRSRAKPILGSFGTGDEHHNAVNRLTADVIEHGEAAGLELDFNIDSRQIPQRSARHSFDSKRAAESADYTYNALDVLKAAGYKRYSGWQWGYCTKYALSKDGYILVKHKDFEREHIATAIWTTNSNHPVPYGFNTGSQHHQAVISCIEQVIKHAETHNIKLDFSSIPPRPPRTIVRHALSA